MTKEFSRSQLTSQQLFPLSISSPHKNDDRSILHDPNYTSRALLRTASDAWLENESTYDGTKIDMPGLYMTRYAKSSSIMSSMATGDSRTEVISCMNDPASFKVVARNTRSRIARTQTASDDNPFQPERTRRDCFWPSATDMKDLKEQWKNRYSKQFTRAKTIPSRFTRWNLQLGNGLSFILWKKF